MSFEGERETTLPAEVLLGIDTRIEKAIRRQGILLRDGGMRGYFNRKVFGSLSQEVIETINLIHTNNFANLHSGGLHPHFDAFRVGFSFGHGIAYDVMLSEGLHEVYVHEVHRSLRQIAQLLPTDVRNICDYVRSTGIDMGLTIAAILGDEALSSGSTDEGMRRDKDRIIRNSSGYAVAIAHTLLLEKNLEGRNVYDAEAAAITEKNADFLCSLGSLSTEDLRWDEFSHLDNPDDGTTL